LVPYDDVRSGIEERDVAVLPPDAEMRTRLGAEHLENLAVPRRIADPVAEDLHIVAWA
jgi:hypothetical protein